MEELLLEPLHGDLHELLGQHEARRGGVTGEEEVHGGPQVLDAPEKLPAFLPVFMEEGGGDPDVPLGDDGVSVVHTLLHLGLGNRRPPRQRRRSLMDRGERRGGRILGG